jgi:Protein of unknown function (DUF3124)
MPQRYGTYAVVLGLCMVLCRVPLALGQAPSTLAPPAPVPPPAEWEAERWLGQLLYVPAYTYIYFANEQRPYLLAITLSIRNTDVQHSLDVTSVQYVDSTGHVLKEYVDQPVRLSALGSTEFFVSQSETAGGAGAKFLVTWQAARPVMAPLVEAVMIGTSPWHGLSFVSPAKVLKARRP